MAKQSAPGKAPAKPAKAAPGVNGYKYREQFGVVIVCKDAGHQQRLYAELQAAGHKVKVVCV
ncbi:MAG: hypothetical protein ACREVW_06395 [Burkholderiales bacterium]